MSKITEEELTTEYNEKIDNYITVLSVSIIFGHEMCWNSDENEIRQGSVFWPSRKMSTSSSNKVSPETEIRPDIVIKINEKLGTIGEVKGGLPINQNYWHKTFNQLIKYDDTLEGWNTGNDKKVKHDIVLLVPHPLSVVLHDYVVEKIDSGEIRFKRPFAMVSYHRESKVTEFYSLHKFYGEIIDLSKNEELRKIKLVPADKVLPMYPLIFYDEKPPLPYTMDQIWTQISNYINIDERIEGKRDIKLLVDSEKIIDDLKEVNSQNGDDPRNPALPKARWIREALSELKRQGYLESSEEEGKYYILYDKFRRLKNPKDTFIRKIVKTEVKTRPDKDQLDLFQF